MKTVQRQARQGDLLFIRQEKAPNLEVVKKAEDNILARGELTGHMHQAHGNLTVFDFVNSGKIIQALDTFEVTHNEHGLIAFERGDWEVRRQREYTPEGIKRVED